ncbi:MAG: 50S ribosomal protein L25/general stress protein Ctc [Bacteroidetes bacterium]|nr:50S ribosomal protein L25/general stress protein Ctc [Bacteroidota bacterium]
MKTILLKGEKRENLGTKFSKALRNEGKVPCVLYSKDAHEHFIVYRQDFKNLVYTPNTYKVKLLIDGSEYNAILQDIQFDPVNDVITHADFLKVDDKTSVTVGLPVTIIGTAPGVRAGGKLIQKISKMQVKGLLNDLPDSIEVNIETLNIGQSIKVKDIVVNKFQILDAPENAIVTCKVTRAVVTTDTPSAAPASTAQ